MLDESVKVCDECATDLQRKYARIINLELLEPPPGPPPELLSKMAYLEAIAQLGQIGSLVDRVGRILPRFVATLKAERGRIRRAGGAPDVEPMIELAEALEPFANVAIRLTEKLRSQYPVSVEDKPAGRC
jgi:hypothetical protein